MQSEQSELHFPGLRLLLIDDDPLNTQLLSLMLKKKEVACLIARSGAEGLRMLEEHEVDLVLTDLQMPEMHGEEVASAIHEKGLSLPVIAFTARVTLQKDYFQEKGFQGVLHKPFREKDVSEMLLKHAASLAEAIQETEVEPADFGQTSVQVSPGELKFSLDNIYKFLGDDQQALYSFLNNFLKSLQEAIEKLETAHRENDFETLGYYAHKLYPNVSQLAVDELPQLLRDIENNAREDSPSKITEASVSRTLILCRKLEKALHMHLKSLNTEVS